MDRISFAPLKIEGEKAGIGVPLEAELTAERHLWLEAMIDHIPDFIFAKDLQGRFLFGNKALIKNNGLGSINEIIGKTDFDFLPETAAQSVTDIENRVAETGQADLGFEEMAELGDKDRWLMMSRVPLRNAAGEIIGVVGVSRDITVRKSAERLMGAQANLLEIIARGAPLSVFIEELINILAGLKIGLAPAVLLASGEAKTLKLATGADLPLDYTGFVDAAGLCLNEGPEADFGHHEAVLSSIFETARPSHEPHSCRCIPIPGADGDLEGLLALHVPAGVTILDWREFLAIVANMTGIAVARDRAEEKIRFLAEHDALTGLVNRSLFDRQLAEAVSRSKASKTGLVLAFLDLDDFKLVNDTLGHAAGDELLRIVADRIRNVTRATDIVARIGGDEFVVILDGVQQEAYVEAFSRIHEAVAAPVSLGGGELQVSCSIGLASYPSHGASAAELLMSADTAMYHAKQSGRNCIQIYDAEMAAAAKRKISRTEELRQALNRNEFELHFQPQQNQRSGKIVGVEALIRWNHPTEGVVFPNDFIPLAEETGLIVDIGGWVAAEACRIGKGWQDQGLEPVRISINVSARQFQEGQFVKTISHALSNSGLDACWLEVEVTESLIMSDLTGSIAKMNELTELGVSLAVDDFGTGYSSLSVLKKFPLSRLKIDRSFITDIPTDQDDMSITSAIISLAQKLGLAVIAEGVETEDQAKFLVESGCHEIQGYLFSRPVSETAFIQMLKLNDELDTVGPLAKVA